jgi:AcrR family transcriptional regulator
MSDAPEPDLPRGIALAWGVAATPQRGPKREMSVERIVEAAVDIADAEGLGAVSMTAVAARLGFTPMSLYRYVSAKDDLVLLMNEYATGVPDDAVRAAGDWRSQLTALHRQQVDLYRRHPWVLDVPISGSPVTPNSAAWMDAALHALADTPLTQAERLAVVLLVTGHARWAGIVMAGYARTQREGGLSAAAITDREDALYRSLVTADAFPALRAAIDDGAIRDDADPFAFGLERSLDGVADAIAAAAEGRHAHPVPWPDTEPSAVTADKRLREARKAVREAEKSLRDARRAERQTLREAHERADRARP